jgi:Ran GTPase-activating protein (RanGAP) involved in mRNA processing and transport
MRLPKPEVGGGGKKGAAGNKKKEIKLAPEHMALERIDLSGFKHRRFSRSGFRELLDGLYSLPCIRTVILRDNGINEDCETEILDLFSITSVKCIDLSKNSIGPKLAGAIGKKLKDDVSHI